MLDDCVAEVLRGFWPLRRKQLSRDVDAIADASAFQLRKRNSLSAADPDIRYRLGSRRCICMLGRLLPVEGCGKEWGR